MTISPRKWSFGEFFCKFWLQCTIQQLIVTKWLEIDQHNLRTKFSALNVDFSSLSTDPLGSRRPAQVGIKDGYPHKSGYFIATGSCSMKTVEVRHRHTAYHNKQ